MVEMEERDLLLASLRTYLEHLQDTGLNELPFAQVSPPAIAVAEAPLAQGAADASIRGVGNPRARLLFVLTGAGFEGASWELLARIIQAMGFALEEVFLLSLAPWAPAASPPLRASLLSRIGAIAPEVVVALGEPAAQLLLQSRDSISILRGSFADLEGIPLMVTLHPDQLVADESRKREVWKEMQQVMGRLEKKR